ncbi:MAG: hypothetical protein EXS35_18000 [Pedosphaera sp.]|nr:hypothetical protein [Pedosphaera sp.]
MKSFGKIAVGVAAGLLSQAGARGDIGDLANGSYQKIAVANIFRLQPRVELKIAEVLPPPPPKITLQGIICAFNRRQVLFKVALALHPGDAPKEFAFVLNEWESQGEITVLEINETARKIKFNNHGREQLLSLEKDSVPAMGTGVPSVLAVGRAPVAAETRTLRPLPSRSLSADEQTVLIELNRRMTEKQVRAGAMPPLPPTGITP